MNVVVSVRADECPDPWTVVAMILDGIEPGASSHCVEFISRSPDLYAVRHHRLNTVVTVVRLRDEPTPARTPIMPPV
jgi:hypothetical protein